MMHSNRQAVEQQKDERKAAQGVTVEAASSRLRRHRVESDIGWKQPEVDDRV
jgi:hypothetical protein